MSGVLLPVKAGPIYHLTVVDEDIADEVEKRSLSMGSHGYAQGAFPLGVILLHRFVMGCRTGDGQVVDHINRDRLDNRRANLRIVSHSENTQNRVSGPMRGVSPTRYGRYAAHAKHGGIKRHLGTYDTAAEAHAVAAEYRRQHFTNVAT